MKKTYKAYYSDVNELIYKNEKSDNLYGLLPLGTIPDINDMGTLNRQDDGDPYERAGFITLSGRHIIVELE